MGDYRSVSDGYRELARSEWMQGVTLEVARKMAGNANAVGDSVYEAASQTVRSGWANESRAGAVVRETQRDWRDARDAVLLRVRDAMNVRGGG